MGSGDQWLLRSEQDKHSHRDQSRTSIRIATIAGRTSVGTSPPYAFVRGARRADGESDDSGKPGEARSSDERRGAGTRPSQRIASSVHRSIVPRNAIDTHGPANQANAATAAVDTRSFMTTPDGAGSAPGRRPRGHRRRTTGHCPAAGPRTARADGDLPRTPDGTAGAGQPLRTSTAVAGGAGRGSPTSSTWVMTSSRSTESRRPGPTPGEDGRRDTFLRWWTVSDGHGLAWVRQPTGVVSGSTTLWWSCDGGVEDVGPADAVVGRVVGVALALHVVRAGGAAGATAGGATGAPAPGGDASVATPGPAGATPGPPPALTDPDRPTEPLPPSSSGRDPGGGGSCGLAGSARARSGPSILDPLQLGMDPRSGTRT